MDKNKIKFVQYNSKKEFLDQNLDILLQDEAQNEIIIGIVLEHKSEKVNRWLLGRIEYDSQVKIVFIVDDDKQGLLTYIPSDKLEDEIVECLVKNILDLKIDLKEMLIENKFSDKILNRLVLIFVLIFLN